MKSTIKFEYSAHYRTSHIVNRQEKEIFIALHGYGQLSEFFLRKLHPIFFEDRLIIVPEATNYAYLQGFSGRVGANWMTKHEREIAIVNNNNYLNALLQSFLLKYSNKPKIKVMGFSQGAATATRWVSQLDVPVDTLILWGGGFAHDLDLGKTSENLQGTKCYIALGDQDEFVTEESIQKQDELIKAMGLEVERLSYPGGHDLEIQLLAKILEGQKLDERYLLKNV